MQAKLELHHQEDQLARIIDHPHHYVQLEQHNQQEPGQSPSGTSHSPSSVPRGICYQIAPLPSASSELELSNPAVFTRQIRSAPTLKLEAPSDQSPSFLSGSPSSGIADKPGIVAAVVNTKDFPSPNHTKEESKLKIGPPPPSTPLSPHHYCSSHQGTESIPHIPHPSLSTSTPQLPNPGFTGSAAWRRRLSKTRSLTTMTASSVKRSLSSPNVQQAAAMSAEGKSSPALPFSAGKGRNKLGYHRTSVACGHCRRRKIRCLLSKDDQHGRCSNCIRLKKECNFYPVENTDRRPRSMSKPDITSQDTGSSGSSPSPGLGAGQLSESVNGYPDSVPDTPTWDTNYEFSTAFDHQFMQNSLNRSTGRVMGSQSASVSRRPSMAQMHAPASVKIEPGYLDPVRSWELPSQPESSTRFPGRAVLEESSAGLSSILWRATGTPVTGNSFTQQNSLASDSMDNLDDGYWASQAPSQAPSRLGSIDQGMNISFSYPSAYSSDADLCVAPDMYSASASASTASLTASISDASHYGDNHQLYANQWADHHGSVGNGCGGLEGIQLEPEIFDSQASFTDDEHYIGGVDDTPFFPSLQDTVTTLPQ